MSEFDVLVSAQPFIHHETAGDREAQAHTRTLMNAELERL